MAKRRKNKGRRKARRVARKSKLRPQTGVNQHMVFVYGSLKRGFGNYYQSGLCAFPMVAEALTMESGYTMKSYGAFPGVIEGGKESVWGELFHVDSHMLALLDHLEGNGTFYTRHITDILLEEGKSIQAWMYTLPRNSRYVLPTSESGVEVLDIDGIGVANWTGI